MNTSVDLSDPNSKPPLGQAVPLAMQHVLAMFASNVTPAIIIAGAAGFGFGSDAGANGFPDMNYMIQMCMLFAGVATLIQTIGVAFVGARLPIMMGTSFAFIPVMIPIVAGKGVAGMDVLMGAIVVAGVLHGLLGSVIGRLKFLFPPLVTGLVVVTIGLALLHVGVEYAAGGVPLYEKAKAGAEGGELFGNFTNWIMALTVIFVTLGIKFFARGFASLAAVLLGLVAGYLVGLVLGQVSFGGVARASWFGIPEFARFGMSFDIGAIIAVFLVCIISAIETVGDTNGITKGGAGREATAEEVAGATWADGLGSALAGLFGSLPNTSFSQNVGLVAMTGIMSRFVVMLAGIFLIICGLVPKVGAVVSSMPIAVLGGGVIIMFGMIVSAGLSMLQEVTMNRRNMIIIAVALSVGLGLQAVPEALQHVSGTLGILLKSGLVPVALIAVVLNQLLPEDLH